MKVLVARAVFGCGGYNEVGVIILVDLAFREYSILEAQYCWPAQSTQWYRLQKESPCKLSFTLNIIHILSKPLGEDSIDTCLFVFCFADPHLMERTE